MFLSQKNTRIDWGVSREKATPFSRTGAASSSWPYRVDDDSTQFRFHPPSHGPSHNVSQVPAMSTSLLGERHRPERRRRIYLFAVTAGSMFLLGLAAGHKPAASTAVRAVIVRDDGSDFAPDDADEITNDENLRRTLDQVATGGATPEPDRPHDFKKSLHVNLHAVDTSGESRLAISYSGPHPAGADLVNTLARRYVDTHAHRISDSARQAIQAAKQTANQAHKKMVTSRSELDTLLAKRLTSPAMVDTTAGTSAGSGRKALEKELATLRATRIELLVERTPLHPVVQDVEAKIGRLEARLAETSPQAIADSQAWPRSSRASETTDQLGHQAALAAYEKLRLQYADARDVSEEKYEAARALEAKFETIGGVKMHVSRWATPALPDATLATSSVVMAILLAVFCGSVIAIRGVPDDPTFRAGEEVEAELTLPVVGVVPAEPGTPRSRPFRLPITTRCIKLGSEVVLAVFLFCVTLLGVVEADFPLRLAHDPLAELSAALAHAGQVLGY